MALSRAAAERKATFCLSTGIAPSEYDGLTPVEEQAFIKRHNKMQEAAAAAMKRK